MPRKNRFISILILLLFFSMKIRLAKATEEEDYVPRIRGFLTKTNDLSPGLINSEELSDKWNHLEEKINNLTTQGIKKILSLVMEYQNDSQPIISSACSRDIMKTLSGLKKRKPWAYEMIDSSGKLPAGIMSGHFTSLGDYEECLGINASGNFYGKYCTLELETFLPRTGPYISQTEKAKSIVGHAPRNSILRPFVKDMKSLFYYLVFFVGVCLPSTCSKADVRSIFDQVLKSVDVKAEVTMCRTREDDETVNLDTYDILALSFLSTVAAMTILGTLTDLLLRRKDPGHNTERKRGLGISVLLCFSAYANTKRLFKQNENSIGIFNGMKLVTTLWVVLNHVYVFIPTHMFGSLLFPKNTVRDPLFHVVLNGYFTVETFFFISAVLLVYGAMTAPHSRVNIPVYILRRVVRLLPPVIFVICASFPVRFLATGPVWNQLINVVNKNCKNMWWTNLLFVNNYISGNDQCLAWLWYVPVEMHLFAASVFVVAAIRRNTKFGVIMICGFFACGVILAIVNHIIYSLPPTVIVSAVHYPDDIQYYLDYGYYRTHVHVITYSIGLAVGYILSLKRKVRISSFASTVGYVVAMILSLAVVYGVRPWNLEESVPPSLAVSILYAVTSKIVWAAALSWVTFTCVTGNSGIINSALGWKVFTPLSRLTYMVYLIHPVMLFFYVGNLRAPISGGHISLITVYLAVLTACFLSAYVCSITFEAPFTALEKLVLSRKLRDLPSENSASSKDNKDKTTHMQKDFSNGKIDMEHNLTEDCTNM